MGRFQRPLIFSILIAIGIYFGAVFLGDFEQTKDSIMTLSVASWAIILGLSLLNYVLRYIRWQWYIADLSHIKIPHWLHLSYYVSGFALSTTPGKAGETIRSLYLKKHKINFNLSISAFFVERFLDLLAILLLSALAAYHFPEYRGFLIITVVLITGCLPLIHSKTLLLKGEQMANRLQGKAGKAAMHIIKLLESSAMLLKNQQLFGGLILGLVAWGAEGVGFWYTLNLMGYDLPVLLAVSIYGIAVLVGALSFLPGGLGSTELVMGLLLVAMGVAKGDAVAATLICRIATLWFAVFIGLGVAGILTFNGYTLSLNAAEEH